jgi:hypothetical protein
MTPARRRDRHAKLLVANVINQILATPTQWTNSAWHCGSKHCFFGWADVMATEATGKLWSDILAKSNAAGKGSLNLGESALRRLMGLTLEEVAWIADDKRTIQEHYAFAVAHLADMPTILHKSLFSMTLHPEFEELLRRTVKLDLTALKPLDKTTIQEDT